MLSALKTMLKYAWRNEDIQRVPPFPKLSYKLPEIEYITLSEQEKILSYIPELHRPIFQYMMEYGCRPGEARALQRDCIKDGNIIIKRAFANNLLRETTKSGKTRQDEITPYFQEILDNIPLNISQFVFVREDGKPYTSKNLNEIWHNACEMADIHIKLYNGVRHSLACQLLDKDIDIDIVRQQLGHNKIEMTQRYAKRSNGKRTEVLESRRKNIVTFKKKVGE